MSHTEEFSVLLGHEQAIAQCFLTSDEKVETINIRGAETPEDAEGWERLITNVLGSALVLLPAVEFADSYTVQYVKAPFLKERILSLGAQTVHANTLILPGRLGSLHTKQTNEGCHVRFVRRDSSGLIQDILMIDFDHYGGVLQRCVGD